MIVRDENFQDFLSWIQYRLYNTIDEIFTIQ